MTQLALLLALSLIGVVLSFGFGRLEVKRGQVSATVKRAEGALERAGVAVLRLGAARGLALAVVPALGLATFALLGGERGSVPAVGRAAFLVVAVLAGAASALVQARLALGLGTRAASAAAGAVARGSARAMRPLIRAAAAVAIFGEGFGVLGVAAAFASLYAVRGGFAAAGGSPDLGAEVVRMLPAFALGAAVTALALSREGSIAATAARIGASQAGELDSSSEGRDARDPALLAELVGHLTGELLPRALTSYVCGLCASVSAALLALSSSATAKSALSWLVLMVLVRGFGAIGSVCGVLAARASDEEAPLLALWRGLGSALAVSLFGLGAALFWLEREHMLPLFAAGALGLASMALVGLLSWLPLRRGPSTTRELNDARASGEAASIARGAGSGLAGLWPALVVPAVALAGLERAVGQSVPAGLLLVAFAAGALALAPFALSLAGFGLLATHARGVVTLARLEVEPRRRGRLEEASVLGSAAGATHASLALALSLLLGLLSLTTPQAPAGSLGVAAFATVGGVVLVLVLAARATRSAVHGARLVSVEVERQLREFPRQQGVLSVPADFTPSYKGCVEAAFDAARAASSLELGSLLAAPFLLGALLHFGASPTRNTPLLGFALAALLAGLVFALGGRATRATLGELRRRLARSEAGAAPRAATEAESFGELVGVTAASSVEALALVLALTVLCLAPLLS
ncbi:MAG TPA: sodium/proton-translocating pyrophosphatase [Polyangiaceae bacterium]|nr:sodium/proton-translocating pyrophosphatase [Polyangiaceae bacterium]